MSSLTDEADPPLAGILWRALGRADRLIGVKFARFLAALVLRSISRSRSGYVRTTYRLVESRDVAPGVERLPSRWWTRSPSVTAKRVGFLLDLDLRDNLQRVLYFTGAYEPDVRRIIEGALGKGDVFVDVGAHIGVHSLPVAHHLRQLGGGKVFAFEPSATTAVQLQRVARSNDLDVEIVQSALSDQNRTLELRGDERYADKDLGILSEFGSGDLVATVQATTFDAWASETGLTTMDVLKLDVEGGELRALQGMRASITEMKPRVIIVETKEASLARANVNRSDIHRFLGELGYRNVETVPFSNDVFVPG